MTREEAIEAFRNLLNDIDKDNHLFVGTINPELLSMAIDALKTQLSTESTTFEWIPVSERLPEEEKDVLVTRKFLGCKDGSHGWNNHIPPKIYVEVANRIGDEWSAVSDEYKIARSRHTDPVAWMPLPEPYREGGD